ncbi:hypothetical protein FE257_001550 [Aspergillus nanangensis]|uniref:ubiquitinyl hydrolase 1 n=1 Tax=Aspergillus nanangensis TaxID=2582783 RepID=A0AAD4CVF4_ASPNN|nr:hypothetical protein FE257_001550 [Aspergillus nanangensis]
MIPTGSSHDRIAHLENSDEISVLYAKSALDGSSEAPAAEDEVDHHYICLVKQSNGLFMLDGDLEGPVYIGELEDGEDVLTTTSLDVIRAYTDSRKDGAFALLGLVDSAI